MAMLLRSVGALVLLGAMLFSVTSSAQTGQQTIDTIREQSRQQRIREHQMQTDMEWADYQRLQQQQTEYQRQQLEAAQQQAEYQRQQLEQQLSFQRSQAEHQRQLAEQQALRDWQTRQSYTPSPSPSENAVLENGFYGLELRDFAKDLERSGSTAGYANSPDLKALYAAPPQLPAVNPVTTAAELVAIRQQVLNQQQQALQLAREEQALRLSQTSAPTEVAIQNTSGIENFNSTEHIFLLLPMALIIIAFVLFILTPKKSDSHKESCAASSKRKGPPPLPGMK